MSALDDAREFARKAREVLSAMDALAVRGRDRDMTAHEVAEMDVKLAERKVKKLEETE